MPIVSENIGTTNSMSWSDPETARLFTLINMSNSCSSSSHMLTILCNSVTEGAMIKISSAYYRPLFDILGDVSSLSPAGFTPLHCRHVD